MIYFLSGWSAPVLLKGLRWAARVLLVCALLLGVVIGANWLSHQNWGSGTASFNCTDGGSLTWRSLHNGDILIHCNG